MNYTSGYICSHCGVWVHSLTLHCCPAITHTAGTNWAPTQGKTVTLSRELVQAMSDLGFEIQVDTKDIEIAIDGKKIIIRKKA